MASEPPTCSASTSLASGATLSPSGSSPRCDSQRGWTTTSRTSQANSQIATQPDGRALPDRPDRRHPRDRNRADRAALRFRCSPAACDAGRYRDAAAVRAQIRRITGYVGSDQQLDTASYSAFRPDPDVIEMLARRRGGRRGVFTNNGTLEEEVLTRLYPTALNFRDLRLLSGDL